MNARTSDRTRLVADETVIDRDEWQAEHNALRRAGRVRPDPIDAGSDGIPLINYAPAGEAAEYTDLDYYPGTASEYVPRLGITDPLAFGFRVIGDSMLPMYAPGDICICAGSQHPKPGDDCFVRFSMDACDNPGQCTFKRVEFGPGVVILTPLNELHQVRIVPREDVLSVYPVVELRKRVSIRMAGGGCSMPRSLGTCWLAPCAHRVGLGWRRPSSPVCGRGLRPSSA